VERELVARLATTATKQDTLQEIVKRLRDKDLEESQENQEK
jgi:hypothetical protein